jgi:hypothetical protein
LFQHWAWRSGTSDDQVTFPSVERLVGFIVRKVN